MARIIEATQELYGKDAKRFLTAMRLMEQREPTEQEIEMFKKIMKSR